MQDIKTQNILNNVTNEIKPRFSFDLNGTDATNAGQFMDAMMTKLSVNNEDELPTENKIADAAPRNVRAPEGKAQPAPKANAAADAPAEAAAPQKLTIKDKIKAKVKEIVARDQTPVTDDRPVKALKKMAQFLLKAQKDGKISLPPELTQKLQDFLNNADNLKAAGLADFMHGFIAAFRDVKINLNTADTASGNADDALTWPQDLSADLQEIKLGAIAPADKPVTLLQAIRAIKALVNANEKVAKDTLSEKAQQSFTAQDAAAALIPVMPKLEKAENIVNATPVAAAPAVNAMPANAAAPVAAATPAIATATTPAKSATSQTAPIIVQAQQNENTVLANTLAANSVAAKVAQSEAAKAETQLPELTELKPAKQDKNAFAPNVDFGKTAQKAADAPVLAQPKLAKDPVAGLEKKAEVLKDLVRTSLPAATNAAANATAQLDNIAKNANATSSEAKIAPINADNVALQNLVGNEQPSGISQVNHSRFAFALSNATQAAGQLQQNAVDQVIVQLQARANKSSQITVHLSPAELGQVDVRVEIKSDGKAHAVVMADKPETLALLQKDASQLAKSLQQAGLNANAENMSFNLREQRQANQGFGRSKRLVRDAIEAAPTDLALNVHSDGSIISDTRVNYHA